MCPQFFESSDTAAESIEFFAISCRIANQAEFFAPHIPVC